MEGRLVEGYICLIVAPHLHYRDLLQASQDVLYVAREHRGLGVGEEILAHAEHCLRAEGVQVVTQHSKAESRISIVPWLKGRGYTVLDTVLFKRL